MKRQIIREDGSVTIEATISLTAFMFAIFTILTIINICIVQAKMSIAVNATAKELSHYSYLYSLTGIPGAKAELNEAADANKKEVNDVISDVNTVFTEIQNIGEEVRQSPTDITGIIDGVKESGGNIKEAGGALADKLKEIAKDPKGVAIAMAQIAVSDGWDVVSSRLIAAPLSKGLCMKNLAPSKGGDVESYLKSLGVLPAATGSYVDGLDFSNSSIFAGGSNEIRVTVSYDVKIIALLPIDFSFHFTQTAVTHGWLCGDTTYRTMQKAEEQLSQKNSSIWIDGTVKERVELIRHQGIKEYENEGYYKVSGRSYSDIHVYNSEKNQFLAIHSMNPLYSAPGEPTLTLADISDVAIKEQIEHLCAGINDTGRSLKTVETKRTLHDGTVKKEQHSCNGNTQKLVIVIPQDAGLKDKISGIVSTSNTRGIEIEIIDSYGLGARTSKVESGGEGGEQQ